MVVKRLAMHVSLGSFIKLLENPNQGSNHASAIPPFRPWIFLRSFHTVTGETFRQLDIHFPGLERRSRLSQKVGCFDTENSEACGDARLR